MTDAAWVFWNGALVIVCSIYIIADITARMVDALSQRDDLNQEARDE